jgi:pimeloyl-ACP methyl ester carboxylesterase
LIEHPGSPSPAARTGPFAHWPEQDAVISLAESLPNVQERLPRGEVHVIEECGHLPHMEQREVFETLLFDGILARFFGIR